MKDDNDFHPGEIAAQERWQTTHIWDKARRTSLLLDHIPEPFHERIKNAPFFFLATSDNNGSCDCSFKGGGPGIIQIIDNTRLAFPDLDGNWAFMMRLLLKSIDIFPADGVERSVHYLQNH